MHIKAEGIHQCARIVAVADVYDALTSDRVYRKKLKAHEVFEYITALGSHHFDKTVVDTFTKYVAVYPIGTGVILNSKQKGIVARVNTKLPTRPVVRIIFDENNEKLMNYFEIDLSQSLSLFILDSCEI
jgi:HD-GYP domain-containing protein (c-di-GMP phosphodiesterase class II)